MLREITFARITFARTAVLSLVARTYSCENCSAFPYSRAGGAAHVLPLRLLWRKSQLGACFGGGAKFGIALQPGLSVIMLRFRCARHSCTHGGRRLRAAHSQAHVAPCCGGITRLAEGLVASPFVLSLRSQGQGRCLPWRERGALAAEPTDLSPLPFASTPV